MIIINQDASNDLIFTFQENTSLGGDIYLLLLINDFTDYASYCVVRDISTNKDRYNEFTVVETATPNSLNGEMTLRPSGFYHYEIYEQNSPTNLLPLFSGNLIDSGRIKVCGTDDGNYITSEPLISLTDGQKDLLSESLQCRSIQLLSPSQIACLTIDQIQALTPTQIGQLSASQVQALTNTQIGNLYYTQIQALTQAQIGNLIYSQIQELVNSQLANLSTAQLQYILGTLMSGQFLNDNLSQAQKNGINTIYTLQTGQATSYTTGDDYNLNHGRLVDFYTLKYNNAFGNKHRFTDENGNQSYSNHYVIDHATGLGWCTTLQGTSTWTTAISNANSFTLSTSGGTLSGFYVPNVNEYLSILNFGLNNQYMNYAPFNQSTQNTLFTSTTVLVSTGNAFRIINGTSVNIVSTISKTTSQFYFVVRKHY